MLSSATFCSFCQNLSETKSVDATKKVTYEMTFIAVGAGGLTNKIDNTLNKESFFLLDNLDKGSICLNFCESRFFYLNRIGLNVGFQFFSTGLNYEFIVKNFQGLTTDYEISFDGPEEDGIGPIFGSFDFYTIEFGLIGKFRAGNFSFLPYINYMQSYGQSIYYVDINYFDPINDQSFVRSYELSEKIKNPYKFGLEIHHTFKSNIYIGLKGSYSSFNVNGVSSFIDEFEDGSKIQSETQQYQNKAHLSTFQVLFGMNFGQSQR